MTPTYVTAARLQRVRDQLTPLDQRITETLATVGLATTRQLEQLCLPEHTTQVRARRMRRRLQHLRELHVVHTLERSVGGRTVGSAQAVHTLDRAGLHLAEPSTRRTVRPARDRGQAHVRHALAVTQHLVDLRAYERSNDGVHVESWLGERAARIPYRELGRLAWLAPDALVEVHTPTERIISMVEVDRGTESLITLLHKADRYLLYASTRPETPQVVWSLPHQQRGARLAEALRGQRRPRKLAGIARQLFVITTPHRASAALAGEEVAW